MSIHPNDELTLAVAGSLLKTLIMRALVYTEPGKIEFQPVGNPEPGPGEVVVVVEAVGLCGSDVHAYLGRDQRRPPPLILGHEAAGTILEGSGKGKRVVVNPLVTCGDCEDCRDGRTNICAARQVISLPPRQGAFAPMLAIPERNLIEIPADFPATKAALTEPIACGWHAVTLAERAAVHPVAALRCVVLGGGAIGLGAALVLSSRGAGEIFIAETNPVRHAMLRKAGPFTVYDPSSGEGPENGSAHIVIDAFGGEASRRAASALARQGGVIVHIGLAGDGAGLDTLRMTLQEITFIGSYTYSMSEFRDTLDAIVSGRLGSLDWTEVRALSDGPQAFAELVSGKTAAAKIIFRP